MKQYKYSIDVDISSLTPVHDWQESKEEKGIDYLAFGTNIVPGSFVRVFNADVYDKKWVSTVDRELDMYPMEFLLALVVARLPATEVFAVESAWVGREAVVLYLPNLIAYKRTQMNFQFDRRQENDVAFPFNFRMIVVAEHKNAPMVEVVS